MDYWNTLIQVEDGQINTTARDNLSYKTGQTILCLDQHRSKSRPVRAPMSSRHQLITQLYERYRSVLTSYVQGLLRGVNDDAQDVVQSVFTRLSALDRPEQVKDPRRYLFRAARNLVIDNARRRVREYPVFVEDSDAEAQDSNSPEQQLLSREELRILEWSLTRMPRKRRQIFIMTRIQGQSYQEAALQLGMSNAAVQKNMTRALRDCRRAFEHFMGSRDGALKILSEEPDND